MSAAWISAALPPERIDARGERPVSVIGCVDDEKLQLNGEGAFVDTVAWWPARNLWTITYCGEPEDSARDFPVRVTHWQHKPPLPAGATPETARTDDVLYVR